MQKQDNKNLIELLKPLKRKIFYKNMLSYIGLFSIVSVGISIMFMIITHFLPIEFYRWFPLIFFVISVVSGIIFALYKNPSIKQTANVADSFGLEERIITALNNQNNDSQIANLQRQNAVSTLRSKLHHILNEYRIWPFSKKQAGIYLVCIIFLGITFFIPNNMDTLIAEQRLYEETIAELEEELDEQQEDIENNEELDTAIKEDLLSMLDELKDNLEERANPEEQLQKIEELKKELYEKQNEIESAISSFAAMNQILEQNQLLQSLANIDNKEELNEEIDKMAEKLDSLTEEEKEELLESLQQLSENSSEFSEIAQSFQNSANSLQSGNNSESMKSLSNALSSTLNNSNQAQQANSQISNTIASINQAQGTECNNSTCSNSTASNNSSSSTGNSSNSSGNSSDGSLGEGSGTGSGSGTGDGNGNGSGSGSGSGTGDGNGNGSGSGSGNGSGSGGSGSGTGGNGAGLGTGAHVINVPTDRIDSEGITDTVSGNIGEGSYEVSEGSLGQAMPSVTLPYEEVYAEYQKKAFNSIDRNQIPDEYQDIIKEYFGSIEP